MDGAVNDLAGTEKGFKNNAAPPRKSMLGRSIDNIRAYFSKKDKDGNDKKGFMAKIKEMGPAGLISFTMWGGVIRNIYLVVSVLLFK